MRTGRSNRGSPSCPSCGAAPPTVSTRFCPTCGAATDPAAGSASDPGHRTRASGGGRLPRLGWAALAVLAVTGAATAIGALDPALLDTDPASDEAELVAPDGDRARLQRFEDVDPDAAAELRATADPGRLRCAPDGCERWFRPLRGETVAPLTQAGHGTVTFVESGDLVVLDLVDGTERLRIGVDEVVGRSLGPMGAYGLRTQPVRGGTLVIGDDVTALVELDGAIRWRRDDDGWIERIEAGDTHVAMARYSDDGERSVRLIRVADGELVLEQDQATFLSVEPLVLAEQVDDGTVVRRLASDDLTERWRAELGDGYALPHGHVTGKVIVVHRSGAVAPGAEPEPDAGPGPGSDTDEPAPDDQTGPPAAELVVLAIDDGRVLAREPGGLLSAVEHHGMAVILLAEPDTFRRVVGTPSAGDDAPLRFRVLAVGHDGIEFDVEVETSSSRSLDMALWSDAQGPLVRIQDLGPLRLDLDAGGLVPDPDADRATGQGVPLDDTTTAFIEWGPTSIDELVLERDGRHIEVQGDELGWPIAADGHVLVVGERALLLVDPEAGTPLGDGDGGDGAAEHEDRPDD